VNIANGYKEFPAEVPRISLQIPISRIADIEKRISATFKDIQSS
jgi:alpha-D-ribose 1-methylphosphonate 5-triphosphate synthase subunit PhnI